MTKVHFKRGDIGMHNYFVYVLGCEIGQVYKIRGRWIARRRPIRFALPRPRVVVGDFKRRSIAAERLVEADREDWRRIDKLLGMEEAGALDV